MESWKIRSCISLVIMSGVACITFLRRRKRRSDLDQLRRQSLVNAPFQEEMEKEYTEEEMDGEGFELFKTYSDIRMLVAKVTNLSEFFPSLKIPNVIRASMDTTGHGIPYNKLLGSTDHVLTDVIGKHVVVNDTVKAYLRAGPREVTHFDPTKVKAAIITCGGLCPGLNNVIREIVNTLFHAYHCREVYGIRGGYGGFAKNARSPIKLTPDLVEKIHDEGGTILGSSRGGFDLDTIIHFLVTHEINQLYVIGGDGTHRGANAIANECISRKLNVAVAGIPKTIDNDVALIDRSFGFQTSVEAAQAAIKSARVESECNFPNGIGVVKLMGRSAGYIAVHATLASGDVDLCLIPESPIILEGDNGILPHLKRRVEETGHAVVVVAEGAGEELLGESAETDESGNKRLPPIGPYIKSMIEKYFQRHKSVATVKYIDPSYMIRSVPANASDSIYCMLLGQNAVHGAMAGYTSFTVGLVNNRVVYIPIPMLVRDSPRVINIQGRSWERVLSITRQPHIVKPFRKTKNARRASAKTVI